MKLGAGAGAVAAGRGPNPASADMELTAGAGAGVTFKPVSCASAFVGAGMAVLMTLTTGGGLGAAGLTGGGIGRMNSGAGRATALRGRGSPIAKLMNAPGLTVGMLGISSRRA